MISADTLRNTTATKLCLIGLQKSRAASRWVAKRRQILCISTALPYQSTVYGQSEILPLIRLECEFRGIRVILTDAVLVIARLLQPM